MAAQYVIVVRDAGTRKLSNFKSTADAARNEARIMAANYARSVKRCEHVEAIVYGLDGVSIFEVDVTRKRTVSFFKPVVSVSFDARNRDHVAARELSGQRSLPE